MKRPFSLIPLLLLALPGVLLLCLCVGSVSLPPRDTLLALLNALLGRPAPEGVSKAILFSVRLPRVLCVALVGASLSLCGAAMQALLRNPLADGSTLGVSSGASLGAVLALALDLHIPGVPYAATMVMAMVFAFLSLVGILSLAYGLDRSLSTHTILLIGIIFSMFASSLISLVIAFAGEKIKSITFWTMGSLAGSNMAYAGILAGALCMCGAVILSSARELGAFALGEEGARHIGVDVRRVRLKILIAVSALIGVCVSVGGTIAFVGLVTPHMARMVAGPNPKRLLPASLYAGTVFLLLSDLLGRTIVRPVELPIGVVTSLVGAAAFVILFSRNAKRGRGTC